MSKMVTLKTSKINRANRSVILDGEEIKFDEFCMVDVVERKVEKLINAGLELVDEEDKKKFANIKAKFDKQIEAQVLDIDLIDANKKLKIANDQLKEEIKILNKRIDELEVQMVEKKPLTEKEVIVDKSDEESLEKQIDKMVKGELVELCISSKFPEGQWKKLNEKNLKSYIKKQL